MPHKQHYSLRDSSLPKWKQSVCQLTYFRWRIRKQNIKLDSGILHFAMLSGSLISTTWVSDAGGEVSVKDFGNFSYSDVPSLLAPQKENIK